MGYYREKGFTDRHQVKTWRNNHVKIRDVLQEIWFQKFTQLLKEKEKLGKIFEEERRPEDEVNIYQHEILRSLKERGITITRPTLSKHLRLFEEDEELIVDRNAKYPRYKINISGALENIMRIAGSMEIKQPYTYKHLHHPEPVENIIEIQTYKPHHYPKVDSPDSALKKYVANLFNKEGQCIIPEEYVTGKKDPATMPDRFLYQAFREKEKYFTKQKREVIHQSLNYTVYSINKEELFHYLKTTEGKKWLTSMLK